MGEEVLTPARLAAWRRAIAFLPQEPFLFNSSVRQNIAWPAGDISEEEAWSALARAGAKDIVAGLERGLEHKLGEAGLRLSGGERQRICLARLFTQDAALFILDEPTAHLDTASEAAILNELRSLARTALVIVISHSQDMTAYVDQWLEVDGGVPRWRETGQD